jgi:hypothetical protein
MAVTLNATSAVPVVSVLRRPVTRGSLTSCVERARARQALPRLQGRDSGSPRVQG